MLVVSFAALGLLWSRPRLEQDQWRPLPARDRQADRARSRSEIVTGALGVALLAVVIVAGFAGPPDPLSNFAPVFLLIVVWVGMAFASVLFGDVFRAFNPWRAIGRVAASGASGHALPGAARASGPPPPALLIFTWIELASGWGEHPARLAAATLVYTVVTLAGDGLLRRRDVDDAAARRSRVYFNLLGAPLGLRDPRPRGRASGRCCAACRRSTRPPGIVGFVAVMIGTVTFDGLSQGALWNEPLRRRRRASLADTIGLLLGVALVAGFYGLGMAGAKTVGGGFDAKTLARAFVHSLVPIAAVYVAAHYLTFLIFEGQAHPLHRCGPVRPGLGPLRLGRAPASTTAC